MVGVDAERSLRDLGLRGDIIKTFPEVGQLVYFRLYIGAKGCVARLMSIGEATRERGEGRRPARQIDRVHSVVHESGDPILLVLHQLLGKG
jgi:hypothetical protein